MEHQFNTSVQLPSRSGYDLLCLLVIWCGIHVGAWLLRKAVSRDLARIEREKLPLTKEETIEQVENNKLYEEDLAKEALSYPSAEEF